MWKEYVFIKLSDDTKQCILDMYKDTYKTAGLNIWFKNIKGISRYKYILIYSEKCNIISAMMYNYKNDYNKISIVIHNGTKKGKTILMNKLSILLLSGYYIMEASGAVSWLLRNRYRLYPHTNQNIIEKLLQKTVIMNDNFKQEDKYSYVYLNVINSNLINKESLFGRLID